MKDAMLDRFPQVEPWRSVWFTGLGFVGLIVIPAMTAAAAAQAPFLFLEIVRTGLIEPAEWLTMAQVSLVLSPFSLFSVSCYASAWASAFKLRAGQIKRSPTPSFWAWLYLGHFLALGPLILLWAIEIYQQIVEMNGQLLRATWLSIPLGIFATLLIGPSLLAWYGRTGPGLALLGMSYNTLATEERTLVARLGRYRSPKNEPAPPELGCARGERPDGGSATT
jgi:hypothetical protein